MSEVVYLGASTHSVVDVGEGTRLTVLQQNRDGTVDHALARRGETVRLTWRSSHVVRLGDSRFRHIGTIRRRSTSVSMHRRSTASRLGLATVSAVVALAMTGCGSSDDGGPTTAAGGSLHARRTCR